MTFEEFLESDSIADQWRSMRYSTPGLGSQRVPVPKNRTVPKSPGLSNVVVDLLKQGFIDGGILNDSLVKVLNLNPDHNLVAGNLMLAQPTGIYPFVAEKKAGIPTGRIRFVKGFPLEKALKLIQDN
jgi:hypothetical protein